MDGIIDTIKTASVGFSGILITWGEWLPVVVRVAVGIATFFYMLYKAKNEWLVYEENARNAGKAGKKRSRKTKKGK